MMLDVSHKGARRPAVLTDAAIGKAWEFHAASESLLMTRVQALLVVQSFFATAFALLVANWTGRSGYYALIVGSIPVLAATVACLVWMKNHRVARGIRSLKDEYLQFDEVYGFYLSKLREETLFAKHVFSDVFPALFVTFWLAAEILVWIVWFDAGGLGA